MTITNTKDLNNVEIILNEKLNRISEIEWLVMNIRKRYAEMTDTELADSLQKIRELNIEKDQHRAWCDDAESAIRSFFRPAMAM